MNDTVQDIVTIEALRGEFADAAMQRDFERFAALFTSDGAWEIPDMGAAFNGTDSIRSGIEHMLGLWDFFIQAVHPGTITVDKDRATGRSYSKIGRFVEGGSQLNDAIYHDELTRTKNGWRFQKRTYRFQYVDTTPLGGGPSIT